MNRPISPTILNALGLVPGEDKNFITDPSQAANSAYSRVIVEAFNKGVSGILCFDGAPCVAIVDVEEGNISENELQDLYSVLWNQGAFDYLLLLYPDVVCLHTLSVVPTEWSPDGQSEAAASAPQTLLQKLHIIKDAVGLKSLISGIESGRFLRDNPKYFNTDARVDSRLIGDLNELRKLMAKAMPIENNQQAKQVAESIHAVLLQMLFLLYLEDRGIIGEEYIHMYGNVTCSNLEQLLRKTPEDFCSLLGQLNLDLNGGLFELGGSDNLWMKHASILADFLRGKTDFVRGQQGRLVRLYRFEYIPVELLSEIYDRFFHSENEKRERGAYYTPRRLASLVIDQIWDSLWQELAAGEIPQILDPACGSGIFLATLFQRMATSLPSPSWERLRQLAESLYGLDIDPTAIRISVFSLSLALLNSREPKELQRHMGTKERILPNFFGNSLECRDFFDYPEEKKFAYVLGNPPWGQARSSEKEGEQWVKKQGLPPTPNRERSWPFIWKSLRHVSADGALALLLPTTGFFINKTAKNLTKLVTTSCIEKLIDLSALRSVLFAGAKTPACILLATPCLPEGPYTFEYWCPKADINSVFGGHILLAREDCHTIRAWAFSANATKITQIAMWCSPVEKKLIHYLESLPTLKKLPLLDTKEARKKFPGSLHPDWGMGMGFQKNRKAGKAKALPHSLKDIHFIDATNLSPYVEVEPLEPLPYKNRLYDHNYIEGFTAPHIVLTGSANRKNRLNATWAEFNFSYTKSLFGITVPDTPRDKETGKFLTAYLNSSFIMWYLYTTLGLAADKPRFIPSLLQLLPFPQPEDLPDCAQADRARAAVIAKMDGLMQEAARRQAATFISADSFPSEQDVAELDKLIFEYLGLSTEECEVINDFLKFTFETIRPGRTGKTPSAWEPSEKPDWDNYCQWLSKALTDPMQDQTIYAQASISYSSKDVVVVCVVQCHKQIENSPKKNEDFPTDLLPCVERRLTEHIYFQRNILLFEEGSIYLIKPRQRRFWLTGSAYTDADMIIGHLLQAGFDAGELA